MHDTAAPSKWLFPPVSATRFQPELTPDNREAEIAWLAMSGCLPVLVSQAFNDRFDKLPSASEIAIDSAPGWFEKHVALTQQILAKEELIRNDFRLFSAATRSSDPRSVVCACDRMNTVIAIRPEDCGFDAAWERLRDEHREGRAAVVSDCQFLRMGALKQFRAGTQELAASSTYAVHRFTARLVDWNEPHLMQVRLTPPVAKVEVSVFNNGVPGRPGFVRVKMGKHVQRVDVLEWGKTEAATLLREADEVLGDIAENCPEKAAARRLFDALGEGLFSGADLYPQIRGLIYHMMKGNRAKALLRQFRLTLWDGAVIRQELAKYLPELPGAVTPAEWEDRFEAVRTDLRIVSIRDGVVTAEPAGYDGRMRFPLVSVPNPQWVKIGGWLTARVNLLASKASELRASHFENPGE